MGGALNTSSGHAGHRIYGDRGRWGQSYRGSLLNTLVPEPPTNQQFIEIYSLRKQLCLALVYDPYGVYDDNSSSLFIRCDHAEDYFQGANQAMGII